MKIYLDTADITVVERLARILPLAGITTNPSHRVNRCMNRCRRCIRFWREKGRVIAHRAEDMGKAALLMRQHVGDLIINVPATAAGLAAIEKFDADWQGGFWRYEVISR